MERNSESTNVDTVPADATQLNATQGDPTQFGVVEIDVTEIDATQADAGQADVGQADVGQSRGRATSGSLAVLGAAGLGAAAMYFLDPERGARRRSLVRDRAVRVGNVTGDAIGTTKRDLGNRAQWLLAARRTRAKEDTPPDDVLEARVRSELGRVVSHPSAIVVTAQLGHVMLSGPVLAHEVPKLIRRVSRVRGVTDVENRLDVHESPGDVPALQGGETRTGSRVEFLQENWSPSARLGAGVVGGALAIAGARRKDMLGSVLSLAGLTLLARSVTNSDLRQLIGKGERAGIDVRKIININAPLGEVFAFFSSWENWPRFMSHVRSVISSGPRGAVGERTHWVVDGPVGTTVEWDAVTTRFVENETIAWTSVEGSTVQHAGTLQFVPTADGTTRVHIQMSYSPPAGPAGHVVAKLFGRDPVSQMDDDLARLKTTIETRNPPRDAAQPIR